MSQAVLTTNIPGLPLFASGKVRDVYDLGRELLIVTTDRISAYDSVMPNGIPGKGIVLTQLSRFWFLHLRSYVANHFITADMQYILGRLTEKGVVVTDDLRNMLSGRSMLVLKAEVFQVECVVRGYISGSLWQEYVDAGGRGNAVTIHGVEFPAGLLESQQLERPIFTPATKAASGHDINISFIEMAEIVGIEIAEKLRDTSIAIYTFGAQRGREHGVIIADTKFEFGMFQGNLTLCDEVMTPDSSRLWDVEQYNPGGPQASFDKQFVRDWLTTSGWDREPPAPLLPEDIVQATGKKYRDAFTRLSGLNLP